jgi:DeoR family fructose operon transcriptional repressor
MCTPFTPRKLADPSKFGEISFAAFAALGDAAIITTEAEELAFDNYQEKTVVKVVKP